MLVRAPRIVRVLSVSRPDTWRVTRSRKPRTPRGPAGAAPPPPTPVPPAHLVTRARELRGLVDELVELTGCGNAWGVRVLRRNVELALLGPDTLRSADNQLDFIEELAEALWDAADGGFRQTIPPGGPPEETAGRDERRRAVLARMDEIAQALCASAEAWRGAVAGAEDGAAGGHRLSPG